MITPLEIPQSLLDRYNQSGPRYTSYPTAPQFSDDFNREATLDKWRDSNQKGAGLSLYLHFPFCPSRSLYCGCTTETGRNEDLKQRYLQALGKEAERVFSIIDVKRPVQQLALGGGSPASLGKLLLVFLKEFLSRLNIDEDAELSIELDPRSTTTTLLDELLHLGFNRFSFGVQDLNPEVQRKINRTLDNRRLKGNCGC